MVFILLRKFIYIKYAKNNNIIVIFNFCSLQTIIYYYSLFYIFWLCFIKESNQEIEVNFYYQRFGLIWSFSGPKLFFALDSLYKKYLEQEVSSLSQRRSKTMTPALGSKIEIFNCKILYIIKKIENDSQKIFLAYFYIFDNLIGQKKFIIYYYLIIYYLIGVFNNGVFLFWFYFKTAYLPKIIITFLVLLLYKNYKVKIIEWI